MSLPLNMTRPSEGKMDGQVKKQKTANADYVAKADDLFSLLFPDRLGLNRGGADVIDISDDDSVQDAAAGSSARQPRLVVDSDEEQEEEDDGVEIVAEDDLARAIAASKADMDASEDEYGAGPSRSRR